MDTDLFLVIGAIIGVLAFPALLSAYSEGRPPRSAATMIMVAGGLIVLAVMNRPGGYELSDLPDAFMNVVRHYLR